MLHSVRTTRSGVLFLLQGAQGLGDGLDSSGGFYLGYVT
jgi:hypothetical protein